MSLSTEAVRAVRPTADEYAPYYAGYIARVGDGDIVHHLDEQLVETLGLLTTLPEERGGYRYAPGKWSIRQLIGHVSDAERIFTYRALRFARADATELAGFDENNFVAHARFDERSLASLADELEAVRWATLAFFDSLVPDEWERRGVANGNAATVRGLAWIIAGHELHHLNILRTRYLTP